MARARAAIRDTDGGRLDGNSRWDRAVGPMQFIPGTWAAFGVDGDGDGRADPQNVYDATASAAGYLCAGGRDLALASGLRSAILSYNHSTAYLATVLHWQQRFSPTSGTVIDAINAPGTLAAQPTAAATPTRAISSGAAAAIRKGSPPLTPVIVGQLPSWPSPRRAPPPPAGSLSPPSPSSPCRTAPATPSPRTRAR